MGMLIRRRIHEMQEKAKQKEVEPNSKIEFEAVETAEGEDIIPDFSELEETGDKISYEELSTMTVKQIRELAEQKGFAITKIIKEDVIAEFLEKQ